MVKIMLKKINILNNLSLTFHRLSTVFRSIIFILFFIFSSHAYAQTKLSTLQLYSLSEQKFNLHLPLEQNKLQKVENISMVGGNYIYTSNLIVDKDEDYVLDFKNTSSIDRFSFYIYNQQNQLLAKASGGIGSSEPNPFFLRHGRTFSLSKGEYKLYTEVESPYFIAQPVPYITTLVSYQQDIKQGNAIVLIGIGIFIAMGIYYSAISFARARYTEVLYAIFILSNLLFNAGAHQVLAQLFDIHNFILIPYPIIISNIVYIMFIMALLDIHPIKNNKLHTMGALSIILLAFFALFSLLDSNWVNEMARYGVWVFLLYGLSAGIIRSIQGNMTARLYLIALIVFIALASMATIPTELGSNTIYVEHYGLIAIAMEIILLSLVLTFQLGELHRERKQMIKRIGISDKLAHTDAVTQIPNRYSMELNLRTLGQNSSLTYIDMDNLKLYNDKFGHAKGDEMLTSFAQSMMEVLGDNGSIYRVGGDEFAITSQDGNSELIQTLIEQVINEMHKNGFEHSGASAGVAYMHEVDSTSDLKHLADLRMYKNKQQRKVQNIQQT